MCIKVGHLEVEVNATNAASKQALLLEGAELKLEAHSDNGTRLDLDVILDDRQPSCKQRILMERTAGENVTVPKEISWAVTPKVCFCQCNTVAVL